MNEKEGVLMGFIVLEKTAKKPESRCCRKNVGVKVVAIKNLEKDMLQSINQRYYQSKSLCQVLRMLFKRQLYK